MNLINRAYSRFVLLNIAEKLIVINILFFAFPYLINGIIFLFGQQALINLNFLKLSPEFSKIIVQPWSIVTYSFIHGGFGHILWNMLLLYFSSQFFFNLFSKQKFINTYFLGVILGGILFVFSYHIFPVFKGLNVNLIGSSAGVMAVIIFICTYTPDQEIRILFFNLKLKYIGIILITINVIQLPSGNAGGNIAHLGGALFGFLYAFNLKKGIDIANSFETFLNYFSKLFVVEKKEKKYINSNIKQKKIDEILDKINKSGYDSLTKEEKDFLFKAGK
ncbi:MAG: rhomboid family intramembrane serine protease [Flavobacteriaceae bacterium]|nr:rhomboid family intramembrane serine protease [Flavobacteriaceae bacterium]|tara:strand:- start:159 stop:989 length:831 start_codon:yes stop_codon:yes gene_type:complete